MSHMRVLILVSLLLQLCPAMLGSQEKQPLNVQLTNKAWEEFNRSSFKAAMEAANKCIDEFQGSADRDQAKLVKAHTPIPPTGSVSDKEKSDILARGLLNDVATCFYIKGRSAENLKRFDEAKEAYQNCGKYTYARTWDPQGWFWAPAEVCSDRRKKLK